MPHPDGTHSVTNLTLPPGYPGFTTNIRFERRYPLSILSLFNLGMELMYTLSQNQWNYRIAYNSLISDEDGYMIISLSTHGVARIARNQLISGAAILALYQTLETMILQNDIYEVKAGIELNGRGFGEIDVQLLHHPILPGLGISASTNNASNQTNSLSSDEGQFTDKDDAEFKFTYIPDTTSRVHSQDLFLAFLDTMANAADHDEDSPCRQDDGFGPLSPTGRGVIRIFENPDSPGMLSYKRVKRGLYLVWNEVMLGERIFCSTRVELNYAGVDIGSIYIS